MKSYLKKNVSINQFVILIKIIETGSFSKAAEELNLSPSAISKSLTLLENILEVQLIKRSTRKITLTEHGEIIFDRARVLLNDINDIFYTAEKFSEPEGTLRLSCSVAYGSTVLPDICNKFIKKYPKVKVDINLNDSIININNSNIDLAIRITDEPENNYEFIFLDKVDWIYCCSHEYIKNKPPIKNPEDLIYHNCLTHPVKTYDGCWVFINDNDKKIIKVTSSLSSNSSLTLLSSALNGNGIVCLPDYLANVYIKSGKIVRILPKFTSGISHKLYAVYSKTKYKNVIVSNFINFIKSEIYK